MEDRDLNKLSEDFKKMAAFLDLFIELNTMEEKSKLQEATKFRKGNRQEEVSEGYLVPTEIFKKVLKKAQRIRIMVGDL